MKSLPRPKHFSISFVFLGLFVSAVSCHDDNESSLSETTTEFAQTELTIAENAGEQTITLSLDNAAPVDGEVFLTVNALTPTCYSTTPVAELGQLKVDITKGLRKAYFTLTPTDNNNLDGVKTVQFTITTVTKGFVKGTSKDLLVTVLDDEVPGEAGFASTDLKIRENNTEPTKVEILFPTATAADGVLVVSMESKASYGVEYTTQPQAVSGYIFLQVPKGATKTSIDLYPINDNVFKADRRIYFQLIESNGGVSIGENDSFQAIITDDDGQQLRDISSIRGRYDGTPIIITEDTYVEGIVTSLSNTLAGRVVIEDETGALPVQLQSDAMPARGEVILINLRNAQLRELQGSLEAGVIKTYEKIGVDHIVPTRTTLSEILVNAQNFESRTVQLNGVSFTQANGDTRFRGDRALSDGNRTITVRTGSSASFGDEILPIGQISITGILTDCNGVYVLYPQELKDIKKQTVSPPRNGLIPKAR